MDKSYKLIVTDDDPGIQFLIRRAFKDAGFSCDLTVIDSGVDLMSYLYKGINDSNSDEKQPVLVLLDLNMPIKDGFETLKEIKENPALQSIPVFVFSTSNTPKDIAKSYQLGANYYMNKPSTYDGLKTFLKSVIDFSFRTGIAPKVI